MIILAAALGVPMRSASATVSGLNVPRGRTMLGVSCHENFSSRLDALALGLVGGVVEEPVREVEGGPVRLERHHMLHCGAQTIGPQRA